MNVPKHYILPNWLVEYRKQLILPSLALAVISFLLIKYADFFYTNGEMPLGQVSLQFVATKARATRMLTSIPPEDLKWVHYSAIYDFGFMVAYAILLPAIALTRGNANDVSVLVSCGVVFAALLDVVESFGLMLMASDPIGMHPGLPPAVTITAILKFICLLPGIVYCIRPFKLSSKIETKNY